MIKRRKLFFLLSVSFFCFPQNVFAYLDPGTGSMILQIVLAGLAGIGVFFKLFWARIRAKISFCSKKCSSPKKDLLEGENDNANANQVCHDLKNKS